MLLLEDKIQTNKSLFIAKVIAVSKVLEINPDWLMAVMWHESRLNQAAVNSINCVGLIQFCPPTYQAWGFTKWEILLLSNVAQMDLVLRYYLPFKGKIKHPIEMFLIAFYPWAFSQGKLKNSAYVFGSEQSDTWAASVARSNPGFDINKDGKITMKEYIKYHNDYFKTIGIPQYRNVNLLLVAGVGVALVGTVVIVSKGIKKNKFLKKFIK